MLYNITLLNNDRSKQKLKVIFPKKKLLNKPLYQFSILT